MGTFHPAGARGPLRAHAAGLWASPAGHCSNSVWVGELTRVVEWGSCPQSLHIHDGVQDEQDEEGEGAQRGDVRNGPGRRGRGVSGLLRAHQRAQHRAPGRRGRFLYLPEVLVHRNKALVFRNLRQNDRDQPLQRGRRMLKGFFSITSQNNYVSNLENSMYVIA